MKIKNLKKSIRVKLLFSFFICLVASGIVFVFANSYFMKNKKIARIDYRADMNAIARESIDIVKNILEQKFSLNDKSKIESLIKDSSKTNANKVLIVDLDGNVLYKSSNAQETKVDLNGIISNTIKQEEGTSSSLKKEVSSLYLLNFKDGKAYLVIKGIPAGNIVYDYQGESFLAIVVAVVFFIILFLIITNRRMKYFENILVGVNEISKGNLKYRITQKGNDELCILADDINNMAYELEARIERERKDEKIKNELITNVSHDLRTPLTSVMGYLGLLKDEKFEDRIQEKEYIDIAYNKSEKLKLLIDDLFEYTKLRSSGIKLNKCKIPMNEFLEQLIEEMVPICEKSNIRIEKNIPSQKIVSNIDPDKMVRVFENLFMNAVKYSYKPGTIVVNLLSRDKTSVIEILNKGKNIPKDELQKIFDRFYRIDKSRNSSRGGSGLGLAIAKNIVELHGGKIYAECRGNDIKFCVELKEE